MLQPKRPPAGCRRHENPREFAGVERALLYPASRCPQPAFRPRRSPLKPDYVGGQFNLTDKINLGFIVKNVGESRGILSWQGVGGFDGLDRSRTPTNEVFSVVTVQPRAYFFTASIKL